MLHTIIYTRADGTANTITTLADSAEDAHRRLQLQNGDRAEIYATTTDNGGNVIIEGVQAGALTVVKRTTAKMIHREGGEVQYRLYDECRRPNPTDPDALDCISVAQLAILEAIADGDEIQEQYHRAYLALNKHLRDNKQINLSVTAQRTMYIEDINGEIISVNGEINRILAPNERYIPEPDTDTDRGAQRAIIKAIAHTLTTIQLTIYQYMAKGYSERQIAREIRRTNSTVHWHITKIREKAKSLYPNGYRSIVPNVMSC